MTAMEQAWVEVEAAEAATLPTFECGVYTKRVVIDSPIVAGPVPEDAPLPEAVLAFHYEDIEPTPWFRWRPAPIRQRRTEQSGERARP